MENKAEIIPLTIDELRRGLTKDQQKKLVEALNISSFLKTLNQLTSTEVRIEAEATKK